MARTGKDAWYRFVHRPKFDGPVQKGREYVVVLDRKYKLAGVSKMSPEELAKPGLWKEMLRRVQGVREGTAWMLVASVTKSEAPLE